MQKFTYLSLLILSIAFSTTAFGQLNYRSNVAAGDWSAAGSWEVESTPGVWTAAGAAPTSADGTITIRNGHNITVGLAAANADETLVETGGTLTVNNTLTINDGAGTDLEVDGTIVVGNTLAGGAGTPNVQVDGTANWTGGTISVPTTVTATGTLNINTANKTLSTTLTNDGTVNWTASQISYSGGTFNNNASMNVSGAVSMNSGAGTNAFNNTATGTFTKTGATTVTFSISVTNAGTIDIVAGSVTNSGANSNFVNTGTINFGGASTHLTLAGTLAAGNQLNAGTVLTGTGNLNFNFANAAINTTLAPPSTVVVNFTGAAATTISGTGSLTISGIFNWASGRVSVPLTIDASGTLNSTAGKDLGEDITNNGTVNLNDPSTGSLDFEGIVFTNNGTINVNYSTNNRTFSNANGFAGNSFVNNGVVIKTVSNAFSLTFNAGVPVVNNGRFEGIGIYVFSGGYSGTGSIAPGTATTPGIMRTNNAVFTATSDVEIQLFTSTTPGTGHDQLEISTGGVTALSGTLTILDDPLAPLGVYTVITNVGGGTFTAGTLTLVAPSNISNLTVSGSTVTVQKTALFPLPVVWGEFNAIARSKRVHLSWTTLEELNTSHFVVEHSVDGRQYNAIATIHAQGNSSDKVNYEFLHQAPNVGKLNYYRINQVDLDNKSGYSIIRTVKFSEGNVVPVTATPNPVRNNLQISVQLNDVLLVLSNAAGATVETYRLQAGAHQVNTSKLSPGVYYLGVYKDGQKIDAIQLVKQ